MKLHSYHIPLTKINSKWTKELNIRPKTIKILRKQDLDIGLGNDF